MYIRLCNALVAESVDAADLKSVGIYPVPVQVWPSAPIKNAFLTESIFCEQLTTNTLIFFPLYKGGFFLFLTINLKSVSK